MESDKSKDEFKLTLTHVIRIFLTVFVIWSGLTAVFYFLLQGNGDPWQVRGQFGDLFGAVNALFSGLAFAGVIIAILLQREDLALQRRMLFEQLKEFRESKQIAEEHLRTTKEGEERDRNLAEQRSKPKLRVMSTAQYDQTTEFTIINSGGRMTYFNVVPQITKEGASVDCPFYQEIDKNSTLTIKTEGINHKIEELDLRINYTNDLRQERSMICRLFPFDPNKGYRLQVLNDFELEE